MTDSSVVVKDGLETMAPGMQNASGYYHWIYRRIRPYLGKQILEVGPGYGNIANLIIRDGRGYGMIDEDDQVVRRLTEQFPSHKTMFKVGEVENFTHLLELQAAKFDTLLELNVLEHLKNDAVHLAALARYVPGGRIVLFVPAMPCLYGTWDKDAGHYRRYNKRNISALVKAAGLSIDEVSYFNGLGAILWFLSCKVFKMRLVSEGTGQSIAMYDKWILPLAKFLEPAFSPFFGQSLLVVANFPRD
jgi:SAM-dependent methyltransferase